MSGLLVFLLFLVFCVLATGVVLLIIKRTYDKMRGGL